MLRTQAKSITTIFPYLYPVIVSTIWLVIDRQKVHLVSDDQYNQNGVKHLEEVGAGSELFIAPLNSLHLNILIVEDFNGLPAL